MAFTEATKLNVKKKADFTCCWCRDRRNKVDVHHIIPQAEGGSDDEDNAAPLCGSCHTLYGGNPDLRKEIRQRRDQWYELCSKKLSPEASVQPGEATADKHVDVIGFKEIEELSSQQSIEGPQVTKKDVLNVLYHAYRVEPLEWMNSEQIRKKLGLNREQVNDSILALRERGFIEARFLGDRALLRITADGVAVLTE